MEEKGGYVPLSSVAMKGKSGESEGETGEENASRIIMLAHLIPYVMSDQLYRNNILTELSRFFTVIAFACAANLVVALAKLYFLSLVFPFLPTKDTKHRKQRPKESFLLYSS